MKANITFIILFLNTCLIGYSQPFAIGHTAITFTDPSRGNRQIAADLYYPATTAGNNTPISSGIFPLVIYGHGFVMVTGAYQNFWDLLVRDGYIVALPSTEGSTSPNHSEFGADLRFLVSQIQTNGAGSSIPSSSVGLTSAIMGHSMGGGCSFLAAQNNTAITTMVSFAAAVTNPSSVTAASSVTVPTLVFSGSEDCVAPPAQHQDLMYNSTATVYKTQVNISNGNHCYFANYNFNCTFGESTCQPVPNITRAEQQSVVNDFLKYWLAYYLKGDCSAAQSFQDSLTTSSRITYRQSQPIGCTTGLTSLNSQDGIKIYPNPSAGNFIVRSELKSPELRITDLTGKIVIRHKLNSQISIIDFPFSPGIYFARLSDSERSYTQKLVIE